MQAIINLMGPKLVIKAAYNALVWSTDLPWQCFLALHFQLGKSNNARRPQSSARKGERI